MESIVPLFKLPQDMSLCNLVHKFHSGLDSLFEASDFAANVSHTLFKASDYAVWVREM